MNKKKMSISTKMLIGFVVGTVLGVIFSAVGFHSEYIEMIGNLFIKSVKMLIVPLLFSSMVCGVASMDDSKKLGRVFLKAGFLYLAMTGLAIFAGIAAVKLTGIGSGMELGMEAAEMEGKAYAGFAATILNLIPDNPVSAMANGELLQIIVFSLLLGLALVKAGEKGKPFLRGMQSFVEIMFRLVEVIMTIAPFGICALMANTIAKYGLATILPLLKMLVVCYVTMILFALVVYLPLVSVYCKIPARVFLKHASEPILIAASTQTSSAAMSSNMQVAQKMGVPESISTFLISLGNTVNMCGVAISLGILSNFVANAYGINLTMGNQITIIISGIMLAVGAVGVPSYQLVIMTAIFPQVGLPLAGVALVSGVDSIRGMISTTMNVLGDLVVALIVAKSEKELGDYCE